MISFVLACQVLRTTSNFLLRDVCKYFHWYQPSTSFLLLYLRLWHEILAVPRPPRHKIVRNPD